VHCDRQRLRGGHLLGLRWAGRSVLQQQLLHGSGRDVPERHLYGVWRAGRDLLRGPAV
jgi:hypothetical protein